MVKPVFSALLLACGLIQSPILSAADAFNPWPAPPSPANGTVGGVYVFSPSDSIASIQAVVNNAYAVNGGNPDNGQFSDQRYAFLFKPGAYPGLTVPVGYYTSVVGMGANADDTNIGEVVCQEGNFFFEVGALNTFWRSAENFRMNPTRNYWNTGPVCMLWAASQACPLRRVHVAGNVSLFQYVPPYEAAGYASGGFMGNSQVDGAIFSGSQQQWLSRNVFMGDWQNGVWNMVFLGCSGNVPVSQCGNGALNSGNPHVFPSTNVATTPVIAEKPFLWFDQATGYNLVIPKERVESSGPLLTLDASDRIVPFSQVYVATPSDSAALISSKINDERLDVILTPGIYNLSESIKIRRADACVLGIGFPTLVSQGGHGCIRVYDVQGVRIAGLLLQAGTPASYSGATSPLLRWGGTVESARRRVARVRSTADVRKGYLYDCFCRVGGPNNSVTDPVKATKMVQIDSSNVICDNLWLWRADHDVAGLVRDSANPCDTALEVNGADVNVYGVGAEHTLKDLLTWNGERGKLYFFQAEFPYDVTYENYGYPGYVAYRVGNNVRDHQVWGAGAYCFFRDDDVYVENGFKTPSGRSGIQFTQVFTRFLNGKGGIVHIINGDGHSVTNDDRGPYYECTYSP